MPDTLDAFRDAIRQATASGTPLRFRGGGSKDFYGQELAGTVVDTRAHAGIIDYDPAELVITARCGTPLAEIEAALAERRQMLAFEPPHFAGADGAAQATLGGAVAAGLSGPRRQSVGALRDFVLGVHMMDGRGDALQFGGQVMKNVAGYDVSRLMAGSLGTLGLILDVSLKVLPVPFDDATLRFELPQAEALTRLNQWGGQPLPIAASVWHDGTLHVRLSGAAAALRAARQRLGGDAVDEADARRLWQDLREQTHRFFAPVREGAPLWRIAVPSTAAPLALPAGAGDTQLIEWGGGQRWWVPREPVPAETVRAIALAAGGHATLFRNGDKSEGVFTPLSRPLAAIHARLKAAFDPAGIFNPRRMYAGL